MIRNSFVSAEYQPNPAIRQNAAPHARMRKKASQSEGPKKGIALDQTGYGAIQRVHLGPLNRTFPALYFPGSALSVENHCFGPLGQSVSFRRRYPAKKKVSNLNQRRGWPGGMPKGPWEPRGPWAEPGW